MTTPITHVRSYDELVADYEACLADNAALREQVEAFRREQIARSKIDPVTRLHNLCDHLADQRRESPFTAESLELADASYKELCADNAALRKDAERYHFWRKFYDCRFALKLGGGIGTKLGLSFRPARPDVEVSPEYEMLVDAAIDAAMLAGKKP